MFDDLSGFDSFKPVEHDRDDFDTGLIIFSVNNMKIKNLLHLQIQFMHISDLSFTNRVRRLKRF